MDFYDTVKSALQGNLFALWSGNESIVDRHHVHELTSNNINQNKNMQGMLHDTVVHTKNEQAREITASCRSILAGGRSASSTH
jgi:hypothetical protein